MTGCAGMSPPRLWFLAVLMNFFLQDSGDTAASRSELLLLIKARTFQNLFGEAPSGAGQRWLAGDGGEGWEGVAVYIVFFQKDVCRWTGDLCLKDPQLITIVRALLATLNLQALLLMQTELLNAIINEAGRGLLVGHSHLSTIQDFELLRVVKGVLIVSAGFGVLFHGSFR